MRRFRALIKKEITHMIRDPRTLIFVFLMPILQLVLLGYANNTDVKNVSTVIFNQDNSEASRALLDSFQATGYFSFDYSVYSQNEVDKTIASGKARVGIVIPPDYAMRLASGENSSVLVLIDGSDPTIASYVLSAAQLAGQAHGVSIRAQQLSLSGAQMAGASGAGPVDVRTRVLYNPDLQGSYNIVPGLIAIILFQTATSLTALAIVLSMIFNFVLNRRFSFGESRQESWVRQFIGFIHLSIPRRLCGGRLSHLLVQSE